MQFNIVVISNIVLEPYFTRAMQSIFMQQNIYAHIEFIRYEEYSKAENQAQISRSKLIIVCLNFECLFPDATNELLAGSLDSYLLLRDITDQCQQLYRYIREQMQLPCIWFGFEDYCYHYPHIAGSLIINDNLVDHINQEIYHLFKAMAVSYVDLKRIIAVIGINNAYNDRNKYRWNSPYTKPLIIQMCKEIYKQYLIHMGNTKKCIVLDCDNVLWGGILSEDGIDGIHLGSNGLGRPFQDFQRFLLSMYYQGVILTICSKNNFSDVIQVFREHSEMILREEHIACFQVNWDSKVDNIKKIENILNIGLDSMVFIDDSDFEIQAVTHLLPEVKAIKYKRDTIYEQLSCFNLKSNVNIEQVKQRQNTYQTNQYRRALQDEHKSLEEYLNALETKIDIHPAKPVEYSRIAELTQRTNKCTNGNRYTVAELKARVSEEGYHLYSVSVSDKFSNLGLVGTFGICDKGLDLFSLSCRALGRNIEAQMLAYILQCDIKNFKFTSTGKNDFLKLLLKENMEELL